MRLFLVLLFALLIIVPRLALAATTCGAKGDATSIETVGVEETGVFMRDICRVCWDEGNCGLNDILIVVANVANFILSIVGILVFLWFVAGGAYWIISRGDQGLVTKGKKMITSAAFGLVIVLVAYTGVVALKSALTGQGLSSGYVICDGTNKTYQESCGPNARCFGFTCLTACEYVGGSCVDSSKKTEIEADGRTSCDDAITGRCATDSQICCITSQEIITE
jgi:hypothetical protein